MPTDEQRAFWNAIRANPDDDTPRLVYADWLQEHGDEPRAEFIRVQCALERLPHDRRKSRTERKRLEARNQELQEAHRDEWLAPLVEAAVGDLPQPERDEWAGRLSFRRGFLGWVFLTLSSAARLADSGYEPEPMSFVEITRRGGAEGRHLEFVAAVARWPFGACVDRLNLGGATDEEVIALVVGGRLTRLRKLDLWFGTVSEYSVSALARSPVLAHVCSLDLRDNRIGTAGARALAESPFLSRTCSVYLSANTTGEDARALLRERFGEHLKLS